MSSSRSPLGEHAVLPIAIEDQVLDTPALLVDLDVLESNISRMQQFADANGLRLRPHVKTHKSLSIAARQLDAGATGLCMATTSEAEVMMAAASDDLLLAYPITGDRKLERLRSLVSTGRLTLVTDSAIITAGYGRLAADARREIPVLVEVDTGMNRVGVGIRELVETVRTVHSTPGLRFRGIMTHAGHAHDAPEYEGIVAIARQEAAIMADARTAVEAAGFEVEVVSAGSTITAPYLTADDGITEIRPGTYVYNDLRTLGRFACEPSQIAMTALATVVSTGTQRVTLNAGSKTLTPTKDAEYGYGRVLHHPELSFSRLSEEHAVLRVSGTTSLTVGDRVRVQPIHVCVWNDLQQEVYGVRGGRLVERIAVEAMRRSL